ncbi:MetS family NSS transporter small subunit [Kroppenstedtia guangzhouensis]|jgi:hypothetical protein|nr:MetS family NSS transporter small subunit [Kroppenstedtia guangzhouensis]
MNASAWLMFLIGAIGLWGGLGYFLWVAYKSGKKA